MFMSDVTAVIQCGVRMTQQIEETRFHVQQQDKDRARPHLEDAGLANWCQSDATTGLDSAGEEAESMTKLCQRWKCLYFSLSFLRVVGKSCT